MLVIGLELNTWQLAASYHEKSFYPKQFEERKSLDKEFKKLEFSSLLTEDFWAIEKTPFIEANEKHGFFWVSNKNKETARAFKMPVTFRSTKVEEALVRFSNLHPQEITLYLYNRGDAGEISKEKFLDLIERTSQELNTWLQSNGKNQPEIKRTAGSRLNRKLWETSLMVTQLEWSHTIGRGSDNFRYRPEFARVTMTPPQLQTTASKSLFAEKDEEITLEILRARVERKENGDVAITKLPMVDQGPKGYCVVASAERVFRYFGKKVDQHELAQMARSGANQGTSIEAMMEVLKRLQSKFDVNLRSHYEFEFDDFLRFVKDYNRLAKRKKIPEVELGIMVDMLEVYRVMQLDLLTEAKIKRQKADYNRFSTKISKYTENGIPILWSVIVGKVQENPELRGMGGHMRLIIGYNKKTSEIIYTDSWGSGHEYKRMSLDDAWAITKNLSTIEIKNLTSQIRALDS